MVSLYTCILVDDMLSVLCVFCLMLFFFFFKQKTAYEMRISDWSSDVCSSDLSGSRALNKSSTGEDWREERPYTHRRRRYSRATLLADGAEALWLSGIGVARRRCISGGRAVA